MQPYVVHCRGFCCFDFSISATGNSDCSSALVLPCFADSCLAQMLVCFPNVCILRVRMPISDDLGPRNFITKIVKYEKVSHATTAILKFRLDVELHQGVRLMHV